MRTEQLRIVAYVFGAAIARQFRQCLHKTIAKVHLNCHSVEQLNGAIRYLDRAIIMAPDFATEQLARRHLALAMQKRLMMMKSENVIDKDTGHARQRDALDAALKDKGYCFAELSRGEFAVDDAPVLVPILVRALTNPAVPQHPDDAAVDRFADAMKAKLKWEREERGRGGWDDPEQCSDSYLATLLVDHLRKGNVGTFEDVANFAMMLHQRGAIPTTLAEAANAAPTVPEAVRRLPERMRKHAQYEDARAAVDGTASDVSFQDRYWADELDRALAQSGEQRDLTNPASSGAEPPVSDVQRLREERDYYREQYHRLQNGEGMVPNECSWRDNGDYWESACGGVSWYFDSGGTPQEHGMKYCYSCGRPLAAAPEPGPENGD